MTTWENLLKKADHWQKYFIREKVIQAIREFFLSRNFHEAETPLLVPYVIPESYLEYFETELIDRQGNKKKMYLTSSPESSLKKLLAVGIGNCFEITKSFRNTEIGSSLHNPEFTILEWYRVKANYLDIISDCENLFAYIFKKVKFHLHNYHTTERGSYELEYQGKRINLQNPWRRISVSDTLKKFADIDFDEITVNNAKTLAEKFPVNKISAIAKKKGYQFTRKTTWEMLFNQIFLNEIETELAKLCQPVVIFDYPAPMAALAKIKDTDDRLAERFELYIAGLELADCYTELTDYRQQNKRFGQELLKRKRLKKAKIIADSDFLQALKIGLPDCAGIALGIDRLVMLFTDSKTIQETLFFPVDELIDV